MSSTPTLGRYHFQAWARRGIAASLNNPDGGVAAEPRQIERSAIPGACKAVPRRIRCSRRRRRWRCSGRVMSSALIRAW